MHKIFTVSIAFGLAALITGCASTPQREAESEERAAAEERTKCPGTSICTKSGPLYYKTVSSFVKYFKRRDPAPRFNIVDTELVRSDNVITDQYGRVRDGTFVEEWTVERNGQHENYLVRIISDNKGGHRVEIRSTSRE